MQVHLGDCPKLRFKLDGPDAGEMHPDVTACAWNLIKFSFLSNAALHRRVAGEVSVRERAESATVGTQYFTTILNHY